jgi:hypothetical protein
MSEEKHEWSWKGPLRPYKAFFDHYSSKGEWYPRYEYVIPKSITQRFRIVIEHPHDWKHYDLGREEYFAEEGVHIYEEDVKEFAKSLFDTFFQHTSIDEMTVIAKLLQNEIDRFHESIKTYEEASRPENANEV